MWSFDGASRYLVLWFSQETIRNVIPYHVLNFLHLWGLEGIRFVKRVEGFGGMSTKCVSINCRVQETWTILLQLFLALLLAKGMWYSHVLQESDREKSAEGSELCQQLIIPLQAILWLDSKRLLVGPRNFYDFFDRFFYDLRRFRYIKSYGWEEPTRFYLDCLCTELIDLQALWIIRPSSYEQLEISFDQEWWRDP